MFTKEEGASSPSGKLTVNKQDPVDIQPEVSDVVIFRPPLQSFKAVIYLSSIFNEFAWKW